MTEEQKRKQRETRKANQEKRESYKHQRTQESKILRARLIKIIDNPDTSDADALRAITMLHDLDEKDRRY